MKFIASHNGTGFYGINVDIDKIKRILNGNWVTYPGGDGFDISDACKKLKKENFVVAQIKDCDDNNLPWSTGGAFLVLPKLSIVED